MAAKRQTAGSTNKAKAGRSVVRSKSPKSASTKTRITGVRRGHSSVFDVHGSSSRLAATWIFIFWCFLGVTFQVGQMVDMPWGVLMAMMVTGSVTMPHQTIILGNIFVVLRHPSHMWTFHTASELLLMNVLMSFAFGCALMISARFLPIACYRVLIPVARLINRIIHIFGGVVPSIVLAILGAPYTLVSEIMLVPAIGVLLFGVAQLKYAGEDFSRRDDFVRKNGLAKDTLVVLLHGNEFNECQWLFGRMWLLSRPWAKDVELMTVNIFAGPLMRYHTTETETIAGCARLAMHQIEAQINHLKLKPKRVVLIGHSLGGCISAYITEFLAVQYQLPVERVIMWSAPLKGSWLIGFGRTILPGVVKRTLARKAILRQFDPVNPDSVELLRRMARTEKSRHTYCAVVGMCDPLVRPDSAVPTFIPKSAQLVVPYLGHYNIKISLQTWSKVVQFMDEYMTGIEKN